MQLDESIVYKGLKRSLDKRYGKDKADRIWSEADRRITEYEKSNPDADKTTAMMVFPAVALYKSIEEVCPGEALEVTREYGTKTGKLVKRIFSCITALPGIPSLMWKNMDKLAAKMSSGYEVRDVRVTDNVCCMDVIGCPLYDKAKELGAPEAAQMICCMDKEYMNGFRGLDYSRTKSVAEGDDCCDYRMKCTKVSASYRLAENVCYMLNKLPGGGVKSLMLDGAEDTVKQEELPDYMYKRRLNIRTFSRDGFKIYRLRSRKHNPGNAAKRAVLFLPGGGGMTRPTGLHYNTATQMAHETGADIYLCFYPLAPTYNVRFALDWLERIYSALLKKYDPENITFWGDSAGANLILSLTYRVQKKPGRLLVISPACGLENGKNREIRKAMEASDPILTVEMNDMIADNWSKDVPFDSPDISPEYIDYAGFPYMYFFYGEHELFYPHVLNYIDSLKKQGVRFDEEVRPMCHDWAICSFFPEGRAAVRKMCRIIRLSSHI